MLIKLFVTFVTWLLVSGGFVSGPQWLVSPADVSAPEQAAGGDCHAGNWPDRARACANANPVIQTSRRLQAPEKLLKLDEPRRPVASSHIRIYDASRETAPVIVGSSDEPKAPAAYTLAGTTRTITREPAARVAQIVAQPVELPAVDERLPIAAAPLAEQARAFAPAVAVEDPAPRQTSRPRRQDRRVATYSDRRSYPALRIYGVAF